ncbi:auxin-regulated gene involved in organ size [Striga asiatica]|uniref:Auxin-regulated gene involved in organ size n=1 Tax=Striga asiatica TaxID=4170 RepID=A0A5A7P629_STRAF|nr:auxin-regulated gene involved in organ size [Striga asiatica]
MSHLMIEQPGSKSRLFPNGTMDIRTSNGYLSRPTKTSSVSYLEIRKLDYTRSFSQGHGKKMFRYFTYESLFLLVCLTVTLLILPLVLPPLPPPPLMLLLVPIFILALLMVLAFMPFGGGVREATHSCGL